MAAIIPEPVTLKPKNGQISINQTTRILFDARLTNIADFLSERIYNIFNLKLPTIEIQKSESDENHIRLVVEEDDRIQTDEGYCLNIRSNSIIIAAKNQHGGFNATQSLLQLMIQNKLKIPCMEIVDFPRFKWRGYMLDEGRYFLGKKAVKKILDWLALLKINKFHWHLTEDQGWRIEIKKYPKLTEIGSKRKGTPKYRNINRKLDGIPHEGYYTQADIKEIIEYAADRFIEIIPEIEFPGHSTAALAAYPELSCDNKPREVESFWGVKNGIYCLGKPNVVTFIENVLTEVASLFPSKYLHIGGDEVPPENWKSCVDCQNNMKRLDIQTTHAYQVHYTNILSEMMHKLGKRIIFWNEVTDESMDKTAICQYWRGKVSAIIPFLESGGNAIISPSSHYYIDVAYHDTPLKKVYDYEPLPDGISSQGIENIMGIEAEMWGEVFKSLKKVEWCTFPRLLAIAESAWTPKENKNYEKFTEKVDIFEKILDKLEINYADKSEVDLSPIKRFFKRIRKGFGHYA